MLVSPLSLPLLGGLLSSLTSGFSRRCLGLRPRPLLLLRVLFFLLRRSLRSRRCLGDLLRLFSLFFFFPVSSDGGSSTPRGGLVGAAFPDSPAKAWLWDPLGSAFTGVLSNSSLAILFSGFGSLPGFSFDDLSDDFSPPFPSSALALYSWYVQ